MDDRQGPAKAIPVVAQIKTESSSGPVVTREKFAQMTGLPEGVIRGMVDKGHLPTVKVGKYRLINLALITKTCETEEIEI